MDISLTVGLLLILGFVILVTTMVILVWLARRRGRGVVMAGAFLSILAPDPTLEQKIVMVETAKANQTEDDEQDEQ
jgi:hypothetical protein